MKFDTRLVLTTAIVAAAALSLSACATNQKVSTNQLSDSSLTCAQIASQDKDLDAVLEKAKHNKGVSGANVAAVLLFWPAAVGNYMDADKAEELVVKRKAVLADLHKAKSCS
jgi:type IV pilus biogenesis protein CpaD/CtpE